MIKKKKKRKEDDVRNLRNYSQYGEEKETLHKKLRRKIHLENTKF